MEPHANTTSLLSLCESDTKFQALAEFLDPNITMEDLRALPSDVEDLLADSVPPHKRLLMKLFYYQKVKALLAAPDVFEAEQISLEPVEFVARQGRLNLQDRLAGENFKYLSAQHPASKVAPEQAIQQLQEQHESERNKVASLDVSCNDLLDEDGAAVLAMVKLLPRCKHVNLSLNRLQGAECTWLRELLTVPHVEWVDITSNALASSEGAHFFQHLAREHRAGYAKLIWIPRALLASRGWRSLIDDQGLIGDIYAAHTVFYQLH